MVGSVVIFFKHFSIYLNNMSCQEKNCYHLSSLHPLTMSYIIKHACDDHFLVLPCLQNLLTRENFIHFHNRRPPSQIKRWPFNEPVILCSLQYSVGQGISIQPTGSSDSLVLELLGTGFKFNKKHLQSQEDYLALIAF